MLRTLLVITFVLTLTLVFVVLWAYGGADTEVATQVADIRQRQRTDKGSMAQNPYELELEARHLQSQHLP